MVRLLLIIVSALIGISDSRVIRRDYIFNQDARGWLKFHPTPSKWEDAVLTCHFEGAILASPLNANISKAITSVMCAAPAFTGISNVYSWSEYQSMEGVPISDICLSWPESEEPNVKDKEQNCIAMHKNGTATVVSCSEKHPFVCYRKELRKLTDCGTADPKYMLDKRTGSCYKGYAEYLLWTEAYKRCAMDGAHLAIINSQTEAEVIHELAKKVTSGPPKNGSSLSVSIGMRAWGTKRTWLTIQGQSLNDAGYAKWARGEPNNVRNAEYCGGVFAGGDIKYGVLNDVACDTNNERYRFICEIQPKIEATKEITTNNTKPNTSSLTINEIQTIATKNVNRDNKTLPKIEKIQARINKDVKILRDDDFHLILEGIKETTTEDNQYSSDIDLLYL